MLLAASRASVNFVVGGRGRDPVCKVGCPTDGSGETKYCPGYRPGAKGKRNRAPGKEGGSKTAKRKFRSRVERETLG